MRALGVDRVAFEPTTRRRRIVPLRVLRERAMIEAEKARLSKLEHAALDETQVAVPISVA